MPRKTVTLWVYCYDGKREVLNIPPNKISPPDTKVLVQEVKRFLPHLPVHSIERVEEGVSTYVYRIRSNNSVFYLRLLPEIDSSFAPEVYVHQLLKAKGVKVPEVVYYEHYNEVLCQSLMLTTEIQGMHLGYCTSLEDQKTILREAGRDLALINSVPVKHFGWIRRDRSEVTQLEAEFPTYRAFIYEYLESDLMLLEQSHVLKSDDVAAISSILECYDAWLDEEQAWLAHGDFDVTHIYQQRGQYTGIIDFGEIRGANLLYDFGHFRMYDGERLPNLVLPYLIEGYEDVIALPSDYEQRISFSSLLITIRMLAQVTRKYPTRPLGHGLQALARDMQVLLIG